VKENENHSRDIPAEEISSRSIFRTSHTCREGKTVRYLGVDIGASQMPGSEVGMRFCHSAGYDRRCEGPREGLEIPVSRVDLSELEGNPQNQRRDLFHLEVTLSRSCLSNHCLVGRLRTPLPLCIHAVATASAKSSRSNPSSTRQLELPISSSNRYRTRQHMRSNGF
jgi:hypothetical protein